MVAESEGGKPRYIRARYPAGDLNERVLSERETERVGSRVDVDLFFSRISFRLRILSE
jgi:hypothetical protein